jgi:hypothetical protein
MARNTVKTNIQLQDAETWFQRLFDKYFKKNTTTNGFINLFPAEVTVINADKTMNVVLLTDLNTVIPNIKNQAVNTIAVGNIVYCIAINRSMSNFFIAWKF